jgi:hypothetical protein
MIPALEKGERRCRSVKGSRHVAQTGRMRCAKFLEVHRVA